MMIGGLWHYSRFTIEFSLNHLGRLGLLMGGFGYFLHQDGELPAREGGIL
jgi:hypothetical protein